jgi:hypothetical protein
MWRMSSDRKFQNLKFQLPVGERYSCSSSRYPCNCQLFHGELRRRNTKNGNPQTTLLVQICGRHLRDLAPRTRFSALSIHRRETRHHVKTIPRSRSFHSSISPLTASAGFCQNIRPWGCHLGNSPVFFVPSRTTGPKQRQACAASPASAKRCT